MNSFAITTTINGDSYDELIKIVWQREFNQLFCQLPEKPIGKWNFYESAQAKDDGQGIVLRDWAKVSFNNIKKFIIHIHYIKLIEFSKRGQVLFSRSDSAALFVETVGHQCEGCANFTSVFTMLSCIAG